MSCPFQNNDIVNLNVGGTRFSTSRQTLTWLPDSFFSSMLSGRISSYKDEHGAIFIDRDPSLFGKILGYLRSKEIDLGGVDPHILRHEAEFYGITPLVRRLTLCEELNQPTCGGVLFHGIIPAPAPPFPTSVTDGLPDKRLSMSSIDAELQPPVSARSVEASCLHARAGSMSYSPRGDLLPNSSLSLSDLRFGRTGSHLFHPLRVTIVKGHFNWLAVAFPHFASLYRLKESIGWNLAWVSPYIDAVIEHVALNAKVMTPGQDSCSRMLAVNHGSFILLWHISDNGQSTREVGTFNLSAPINSLFFIGCHLVALSNTGKFGVWHAMTQNWQIQDVCRISSHDTTGSFLLLGCDNGSIYNIDMQKFPLRMKDNDLLVTELYKDPAGDKITALSVYITPKANQQFLGFSGNWIEIAYGTSSGTVRIIVQHPETLGQGPQLFQTFTVHCSPVTKVMISEKHLVSVCSEYNHVRTWSVTRFRGMISTQPGSMPLASFKIVSIDDTAPPEHYLSGNNSGPFGEKDDQQVFVQKVVPDSDQLFVRLSSTGKRVCIIRSVDGTMITAFTTHECEGSSRMGSRPRRYVFTGHSNGAIQIWDLSTALEMSAKGVSMDGSELGGPTSDELIYLVDQCDLSNSRATTPSASPSPALMAAATVSTVALDKSTYSCIADVQSTPQAARRRFLAERSYVGSLGASSSGIGSAGSEGPSSSSNDVASPGVGCSPSMPLAKHQL